MIKQVANFSGGGGAVAWGDVTGKPSTFTPASHTHVSADITDLTAAKHVVALVKTARETVTSSTTLQDDDHFTTAVLKANTTYIFRMVLSVSAPTSGGLKWLFVVPSGASGRAVSYATPSNYTGQDIDVTSGGGASNVFGTTTASPIYVDGYIAMSSTTGTVKLQWAQNQSNATGTYIERGSIMTLTEV